MPKNSWKYVPENVDEEMKNHANVIWLQLTSGFKKQSLAY